jgi:hypothetical protein
MPPKVKERRGRLVLAKIDEILAWENNIERDRDTRFVELGRYLCEVRAGQYWAPREPQILRPFLGPAFPGIAS